MNSTVSQLGVVAQFPTVTPCVRLFNRDTDKVYHQAKKRRFGAFVKRVGELDSGSFSGSKIKQDKGSMLAWPAYSCADVMHRHVYSARQRRAVFLRVLLKWDNITNGVLT